MTTVAWVLLVVGCGVLGYRHGHREGIEVARRLGQIAVERERLRCRELRLTQVFGARAERVTRPLHAERN